MGDAVMAKAGFNFTKDNEYYTPKDVVSMFGSFDYDPATTAEMPETRIENWEGDDYNSGFNDAIDQCTLAHMKIMAEKEGR